MGRLSSDLRDMGFERTDQESPIDESGMLWSNSHETVCDQTGVVIDGNHHGNDDDDDEENVYRYYNSERVRMPGGYVGSYDWGKDDNNRFRY